MNNYFHIDNDINKEITYYKLSQIDNNGQKETFKPIYVNCKNSEKNKMLLYPNPSSTELNILLSIDNSSSNSVIKIVNNTGQVVMESHIDLVKGLNNYVLPIDINSGTYTILLYSDSISIPSQRLVIIK